MVRMKAAKITPEKFDEISGQEGEAPIVWGAKAIGRKIGRSEGYVRKTLARVDGTPIRRVGSEIYAVERELLEFFGIEPL